MDLLGDQANQPGGTPVKQEEQHEADEAVEALAVQQGRADHDRQVGHVDGQDPGAQQ